MLIERNVIEDVVGDNVTGVIHVGGHFGEEHDFQPKYGVHFQHAWGDIFYERSE